MNVNLLMMNNNMNLLNQKVKDCVEATKLCYVATINDDDSPNLSPKGSLKILDDNHLIFADIASPGTVENLRKRPAIEVSVVDVFKRLGYGIKGTAEIMDKGTKAYDFIAKAFQDLHGSGFPIRHVIKIKVGKVRQFVSPAYAYGKNVDEESLSSQFLNTYIKQVATNKKRNV